MFEMKVTGTQLWVLIFCKWCLRFCTSDVMKMFGMCGTYFPKYQTITSGTNFFFLLLVEHGSLKWFLCWKLKGKKYVGYCYCEHIFHVFIISGQLASSPGLPKHIVESISKMLSTAIKVSHTHSVTGTITSISIMNIMYYNLNKILM